MTDDPFGAFADAIQEIDRRIAAEWQHISPLIAAYVRDGEYDKAQYCRRHTIEEVRRLERERVECRLQMPPFMTQKGGHFYLHPVTDENRHLLSRSSRSPQVIAQ